MIPAMADGGAVMVPVEAAARCGGTAAVICAAGASVRMGGLKKEYRPLPGGAGLTVLGAVVAAFASVAEIRTIVITVPDDPVVGEAAARAALPGELLDGSNGVIVRFVPGGKTRQASVFNALSLLAADPDPCAFVLIHDGARPWVSRSLIEQVIAAAKKHQAVVPLLPLTETPKETDAPLLSLSGGEAEKAVFVRRHLRRVVVGAAQTPQGFAFAGIFAAHKQAAGPETPDEFTDDAEVWAAFRGPVAAIPGELCNKKITFPEDLA